MSSARQSRARSSARPVVAGVAQGVRAARREVVGASLPEVLGATAQLLLESGVLRPLHRRHEGGEGALLVDLQLRPAALKVEYPVERRGYARLVCTRARHDLAPQSEPLVTLLDRELASLRVERAARLRELRHLVIRETDAVLRDPPEPLPQLGLELLPTWRILRRRVLAALDPLGRQIGRGREQRESKDDRPAHHRTSS